MAYDQGPAQALTFSALMAALSVILYILGAFVPILGFFARLALGVPLILAILIPQSDTQAIGASLVATFILTLLFGPTAGLHYALAFALSALVMGFLLRRGKAYGPSILWSLCAGILGTGLYYLALFVITGMDVAAIGESLDTMKADIIAVYDDAGLLDSLDQESLTGREDFLSMIDQAFRLMVMTLPALAIAAVGLQVLVQFLLSHHILGLAGRPLPAVKPFREWHIPAPFAVPFLLAWILFLLRDALPWTVLEPIVINVLLLGGLLAVINGFAWLAYQVRPGKLSSFSKVLFIFAIFIFFYGFIVFAGLIGLFDMILNLRERRIHTKE